MELPKSLMDHLKYFQKRFLTIFKKELQLHSQKVDDQEIPL